MEEEYSEDDIVSLRFGDALRARPDVHFDTCFKENSLDSFPFEVLCHAFDEYFDGNCRRVEISVNNHSFTVSYDAGISLETDDQEFSRAENIMTKIYTCRNKKKHLAVGDEFCRLGLAALNMISERCELTTVYKGEKGFFVFEEGETVSRKIEKTDGKDSTTIFMKPDRSVLKGLGFTNEGINEKARHISSRLPGLEIVIHSDIT